MGSRDAEYHRQGRIDFPEKYQARDKARYLKRGEEQRARQKELRKLDPVSYIYKQIKSRSKRLGIEFNLGKEDIVIPELCPILLIRLEIGNGRITNNSPSLDRVDNSKGYVKGNVRVISFKANRCKSNLTNDEIKRLYEYSVN